MFQKPIGIRCAILSLALCTFASPAVEGQDTPPPPQGAFKTVHLVALKSAADAASLLAALEDMNAITAKEGYPQVRYRLYKVEGTQAGSFNYLWESSWPSGAVYSKVHNSAAWTALDKKHPALEGLAKGEVYNRYVEVTSAKRWAGVGP